MTMARSRNRLRPIDSRKHVIDNQGGLPIATKTDVPIAVAVDSPVLANTTECRTGCKITSLFLNIIVAATSTAALANAYMMIYKNPGTNIFIAQRPNANSVGASNFKKQVFHQEMVMTEKNTTAIPSTLFKGVLKVPRHFQRMGYDDRIEVQLFSPGVTFDYCVQAIYKDYT